MPSPRARRPSSALALLTVSVLTCGALAGCSSGSSSESAGSAATSSAAGAATGAAGSASAGTAVGGRVVTPVPELDATTLQGRWWTWAASQVEAKNPVSDTTGAQCGNGQPKDIWFLAGSFGQDVVRECTVPAGVPVAFPVVNLFGEQADCDEFMAKAKGTALLDGTPVTTRTYPGTRITIEAVDGNPITSDGGRYRTVACGIWAQPGMLPAGDHELVIKGDSGSLTLTVEYRLAVG